MHREKEVGFEQSGLSLTGFKVFNHSRAGWSGKKCEGSSVESPASVVEAVDVTNGGPPHLSHAFSRTQRALIVIYKVPIQAVLVLLCHGSDTSMGSAGSHFECPLPRKAVNK
jgi:hypothetical protein